MNAQSHASREATQAGSRWLTPGLSIINSVSNSAVVAAPLWVGSVADRFDVQPWTGGMLASVQLLAAALANVVASQFLILKGPRTTSVVLLTIAVGGYLTATSGEIMPFAIGMILAGAALGALAAIVLSTAARSADAHRMFSTLTAFHIVVASILYAIAPMLQARWGMASLFIFLAVLGVVAVIASRALPVTTPVEAIESDTVEARPNTAAGLFGLVGFAFLLASYVGTLSYAVLFGSGFGLTAGKVGGILALASLISIVGPLAGHVLGERWGRLRPIILAFLMLTAANLMLAAGQAPGLFVASIILLFTSLVFVAPYVMALLASLDETGRWVARGPAAIMLGSSAGPAAGAGLLALGLSIETIALVSILFIALSFAAILGATSLGRPGPPAAKDARG